MLLKVSLQFLSEFEAFVPQHLLEFFGRSEGMFDDVFAIIIGERIVVFPSIGYFPSKLGSSRSSTSMGLLEVSCAVVSDI